MDNATPEPDRGSIMAAPKRAAATFLESIAALLALCAKQAIKASRKLRSPPPPPAMLFCPKRLIKNISSSTMKMIQKKKTKKDEWGDGGVWQKTILMGDKCQPLDFSGVIYYDSNGMQLNEVPLRSPRVSPLPGYLTSPSHSKIY